MKTVTELSRADYAVSGNVTRLELSLGENYGEQFKTAVRETTVFAVQEALDFAEAPDETDVEEDEIRVDVDVSEMRPGRRLIVRGTTTGGDEAVEDAVVKDATNGTISLASDLAHVFERDTVVVHGNVASATHGETVQQLLGSARAATPFQRFTLAHDPLTYLQSSDASGSRAALEVRVNDVRWDEKPTLFDAKPSDRAYVVRTDEQGKTFVQFGDGDRGARLPSGTNNVRAKYRKGSGAAGNVKAGALAQLIDRPLGVKGVTNPEQAGGGVDPESEDAARASIPLGVRTLGRAVSLLDYEDFARAFSGVVKAQARVLRLRAGQTVVVTVAFEGGDRLDDLGSAILTHGDPHVQVRVLAGVTDTFRIALKVAVDPTYEADAVLSSVEAALRSAYAFEARELGQPVFHSEIDTVCHSVAGVLAVDVDRLYVTGAAADVNERLLAQRAAVGANGTAIPAGVLILDPAAFDWLEQMS